MSSAVAGTYDLIEPRAIERKPLQGNND